MKLKISFIIILVLILILYFIPAKKTDFFKTYPKKDKVSDNLKELYKDTIKTITVNKVEWKYYTTGKGKENLLFLHGMGGAYDLWWQQIHFFKDKYKVITYTLPTEIDNLEDAFEGIQAILKQEKIDRLNIVGTSMGGYIAQYLVKKIPDQIEKAVFSNTFPPNTDLLQDNLTKSKIIPYLPEIVIQKFGEKSLREKLLPAGENDPLLKAFLPSLPFSKKSFINRFHVVVDPFIINPCAYKIKRIPKLIIESDNDPLVKKKLREDLKNLYPNAQVYTFHNKGHFPYINEVEVYNKSIYNFLLKKNPYLNIEKTVSNYFTGRKQANIKLLQDTFLKNAVLIGKINEDEMPSVIPFLNYLDIVKKQGVQDIETSILDADITNNMAFCKTLFKYKDKDYIDYLTLFKEAENWKIVSKTFTKKE